MIEFLLFVAMLALVLLALTPAHRHSWMQVNPGADAAPDRDRARVTADLRIANVRVSRDAR